MRNLREKFSLSRTFTWISSSQTKYHVDEPLTKLGDLEGCISRFVDRALDLITRFFAIRNGSQTGKWNNSLFSRDRGGVSFISQPLNRSISLTLSIQRGVSRKPQKLILGHFAVTSTDNQTLIFMCPRLVEN